MITKLTTVEELKKIFSEAIINNTDKVTKISDESVLNAIAYGAGKLGQKSLKEIALVESHIFVDSAYGSYLDEIAELNGIKNRAEATVSSGYVRIVGQPGTVYNESLVFKGKGFNFESQETKVLPESGYSYVKVKCLSSGKDTNVDGLEINEVVPKPSGHQYCLNEFKLSGGRDLENDDDLRNRIKESLNQSATKTISFLEQVFMNINPDVLKVFNMGLDNVGDLKIGVSLVNGANLSSGELAELYEKSKDYFSMNELKPDGMNSYGIKIVNIPYFPIDITTRVDLDNSLNPDKIRKEIQIALNKNFNYSNWENGGIIDWIDLINSVKSVEGVNRVLDNYFYPNNDIVVPKNHLPRIRGFNMLNLRGQLITDLQGNLNPIYYPNKIDYNLQATVLKSL